MTGSESGSIENEVTPPLANGEKRDIPAQDYGLERYAIEVVREETGSSVSFFGGKETMDRLHNFMAPSDIPEEAPNLESRRALYLGVSSVGKIYNPKPSGRPNQPDEHRLLISSNYSDTETFKEAVIKPMTNLKVIPTKVESWLS